MLSLLQQRQDDIFQLSFADFAGLKLCVVVLPAGCLADCAAAVRQERDKTVAQAEAAAEVRRIEAVVNMKTSCTKSYPARASLTLSGDQKIKGDQSQKDRAGGARLW